MRISDWSSDVCSSDLGGQRGDVVEVADIEQIDQLDADAGQRARGVLDAQLEAGNRTGFTVLQQVAAIEHVAGDFDGVTAGAVSGCAVLGDNGVGERQCDRDGKARAGWVREIGRASCRERVCKYG